MFFIRTSFKIFRLKFVFVVQETNDKIRFVFQTGTLNLLPLLGWALNDKGEYCFVDTNVSEDLTQREEAAREFRKFYNELATGKDRNVATIEKFLQVRRVFFFSFHIDSQKEEKRIDSFRLEFQFRLRVIRFFLLKHWQKQIFV